MTHSYSNLLFHLIWSTKNRQSLIEPSMKYRLYGYIQSVIRDKNQNVIIINGMSDHMHLLVSLSPTICVSDFIRDIKTTSTKWMRSDPINNKSFAWQEGFAAYTVGYSTKEGVIKYIENQEQHHQHETFEEEYLKFLKMQNINYDPRFVIEVPLPRHE